MTIAAVTMMTTIGTKENKAVRKAANKAFWKEMRAFDKKSYHKLKYFTPVAIGFFIPSYNIKSFASIKIYSFYQRKLKLG